MCRPRLPPNPRLESKNCQPHYYCFSSPTPLTTHPPLPCLPVGEGEAGALLAAGGGCMQDGDGHDDGVDHGDGLKLPAPRSHSPPYPYRNWLPIATMAYVTATTMDWEGLSTLSIHLIHRWGSPGERMQRSPQARARARSRGSKAPGDMLGRQPFLPCYPHNSPLLNSPPFPELPSSSPRTSHSDLTHPPVTLASLCPHSHPF